jgi:BlaI family transcriptional regulator, penicillinase repressor
MSHPAKISESEWEVMNVLWKEGPLTATQVFDRLERRTWKLNTVRTFLTRLEQKGALQSTNLPEARIFRAAVSREECVQSEAESFLNRFFGGATGALLVHFAEGKRLTRDELTELEAIIEQKKKEASRGKQ